MAKRKRSSAATAQTPQTTQTIPAAMVNGDGGKGRRQSQRGRAKAVPPDPDVHDDVLDAKSDLRASPDGEANEKLAGELVNGRAAGSESPLSEPPADVKEEEGVDEVEKPPKKRSKSAKNKSSQQTDAAAGFEAVPTKATQEDGDTLNDPEASDQDLAADLSEIKEASHRPPPVNSSYLPLPWKGRLGYACLCTYLRFANPSIFCSRTTRISSILEHRHPLRDPSQAEHPTKNRPDKDKPADPRRGQEFVERLCLANVRDMAKLIRWNERFGIKFLRLSSEAFPFASHKEYGYTLAPFASEALAEVGKVAGELGHRLTTHPGQFTQLGSPRKEVIDAAVRDLEYHDEMLSLLKLPPQLDRDAVMILHMGGVFGDKAATLDRFRHNYKTRLSDSIKKRLVLENDDMSWSVHDLLPVCQELNIPFVLDFHHNNIIFDDTKIREGTHDITKLFPDIKATWTRKGITPKMHYSEPTPAAITAKQRRKHNPRPATLPPCPPDMDLMIEAKDKEQAVFELMRTFKLPGHDLFNEIVPYVREDENKVVKPTPKKKKGKKDTALDDDKNEEESTPAIIPDEEISMGGPQARVYWPPGMEEWLRPRKREVKKKTDEEKMTPAQKKAASATAKAEEGLRRKAEREAAAAVEEGNVDEGVAGAKATKAAGKSGGVRKAGKGVAKGSRKGRASAKAKSPTPETSEASAEREDEDDPAVAHDIIKGEEESQQKAAPNTGKSGLAGRASAASSRRKSGRAGAARRSYKEEDDDQEEG
ncbi:MAG: hypothetical protein M1831_003110 [Alyxoria varia]|nr:MAG: hypothetical protein M1831_003110 [Alyxoria varia]